ncbi:MAG: DinB family protein [Armatimonadota bacterium]
MNRTWQLAALPGYDSEIGRWLWALEDVRRRRTLKLVKGLDQRTLDWEGPDGLENAIGSLLYHIAAVEMSWLFMDVLQQDFPTTVKADFPHDVRDAAGRLTRVLRLSLADHTGRLERSRAVFLAAFRGMSREDWSRLRSPADVDYQVTPEWAVFHLVEHEAGHAFQISALKARAARHFVSP